MSLLPNYNIFLFDPKWSLPHLQPPPSQYISSITKDLVELNTNTQLPIKLNSTNYPAWYHQIHSLLVARNLDGYITGATPCPSSKIKNTNDGSETDNPEFNFWIR